MPDFLTIDDLDVEGSTVLVRSDLNVPVRNGAVTDRTRITRFAPTVRDLLDRGAAVVVMSHFGRPNGQPDPALSLQPIAVPLAEAVGAPVGFAADCVGEVATQAAAALSPGEALLLENVRFHPGEEANDPGFARKLAALGDVYVNDAFSAAHRAHASTEGIARWLPAAAGRLMQAELDALGRALDTPARPVCAVVGGAKVSSKLELLGNLVARVDKLLVGGGMANTFLAAQGRDVGRSLCEHDLASAALEIERVSERKGCELLLPTDVVVAEALAPDAAQQTVRVDTVPSDMMILDVGPETIGDFEDAIAASRTLVWNGPLGAFETPPFDAGTRAVSAAAAKRTAEGALLSVAGGGDTVAALSAAGTIRDFSYVSTAGGAFLEWLEGKELPGVAALKVAKSSAAKVSAAKAPGSASGSPSG